MMGCVCQIFKRNVLVCRFALHEGNACGAHSIEMLIVLLMVPHRSTPSAPAGEKKDKKEKGVSDKLADVKASGKGKAAAAPAAASPAKPARPAPRRPPQAEPKGRSDDYLAGLDLPSSDSESDEEVDRRRSMLEDEAAPRIQQAVSGAGAPGPFLGCNMLCRPCRHRLPADRAASCGKAAEFA